MIAAHLMRALLAIGYRVKVHDGKLFVAAPEGKIASELRDRIADQCDALKVFIGSSHPLPDVRSTDERLLEVDARRFTRDRLTALIAEWLSRYAMTGHAPSVEVAAWFAAARDVQDRTSVLDQPPAPA